MLVQFYVIKRRNEEPELGTGIANHKNSWVISAEDIKKFFQVVHSMSILAIHNLHVNRQQAKSFQSLNIVLNNKSGPLFLEFNRCQDTL